MLQDPTDQPEDVATTVVAKHDETDLQEHDYRLCGTEIPGFCLKSKSWGMLKHSSEIDSSANGMVVVNMQIDGIREIDFNPALFDRLILPNDNKNLILGLVEEHMGQGEDEFDDIVAGKGKQPHRSTPTEAKPNNYKVRAWSSS